MIHDEHSIELIAEIGLILLLFLIGLELSLPRLLQAGRTITISGLLKVPACATRGVGGARAGGGPDGRPGRHDPGPLRTGVA